MFVCYHTSSTALGHVVQILSYQGLAALSPDSAPGPLRSLCHRAVARGSKRAFLVGDMPFGSYETSVKDAVASSIRMLKEGGMDAVKLEGEV